jgi:signal transduction histidine kinase
MTALRTNLELMADDQQVDHASHCRALQQLERMTVLTDNLLDLSRIEAGSPELAAQPVNFVDLISQISEVYASRAEQNDIRFALDMPDAPLVVVGDATQLQRMVANLLDNAVKFTPPGGVVDVDVSRVNGHAQFAVHDTGIGIPVDDVPLLFNRFRRGCNVSNYPGSGLGLAIVKAIVDAHKGRVLVTSLAHSTTFTVTLPLAKADLDTG